MEACLMLEDSDQPLTIDEGDFEDDDDDISYQLAQAAASDQMT